MGRLAELRALHRGLPVDPPRRAPAIPREEHFGRDVILACPILHEPHNAPREPRRGPERHEKHGQILTIPADHERATGVRKVIGLARSIGPIGERLHELKARPRRGLVGRAPTSPSSAPNLRRVDPLARHAREHGHPFSRSAVHAAQRRLAGRAHRATLHGHARACYPRPVTRTETLALALAAFLLLRAQPSIGSPSRRAVPGVVPAELSADYNSRWRAMIVRPDRLAQVDSIARRMASRRDRYERVTGPFGVPWWWLAAVHELEHSGRFTTSMVITDPIDVPPGQPVPSATIDDAQWDDTARALLRARGLASWQDWSVAGACYQWERYNGFGYREREVPSPYLWSFSNQYVSGKFVRAGVFSFTTVSQQAGAAVLLRRLVDLGAATI